MASSDISFEVGDSVDWEEVPDWPEIVLEEYMGHIIEYGFGPFPVEAVESARILSPKTPPTHPQILTLRSNGRSKGEKFRMSGMFLRKLE